MTFYKFKETEQKGPSQVLNTGPSRCDATCAERCLIQSNPNAFLGFWDIIIGSSHFFVWHFITQTKNNELKKKETSRLIWIKTLISFSLTIRGHTKNCDKFLLWVFVFIYLFFMMYQLMRTQIQIQKRGRFKKKLKTKSLKWFVYRSARQAEKSPQKQRQQNRNHPVTNSTNKRATRKHR